MSAQALIMPKKYFFDANGNPLAFGKVYTYKAGTVDEGKETFTDALAGTPNSNPIILNEEGYAPIFLIGSYYIVVTDADGNEIWTEDNVTSDKSTIYADSVADMLAADTDNLQDGQGFFVKGYYAPQDGGGGPFYWDASSNVTPDGGTVIGTGPGQFKRIYELPVNLKMFGVVSSSSIDQTALIQSVLDAHNEVFFPAGDYVMNVSVENRDGLHFYGPVVGAESGQGARLIPASSASPVMELIGNIIGSQVHDFLFESLANKTYSHAGIGLQLTAASPNVVWRSSFRRMFFRGFEDGLVINCDINLAECFDCYFEDLEAIGCDRYSFKTRGVYHTFTKLFATQCESYVIYNEASNSTFDTIVGDGRHAYRGSGQQCTNIVMEGVHAATTTPTLPCIEVNGNTSSYRGIRITNVLNTEFQLGISVFGTNQTIENVVLNGSQPQEGIRLNALSSGTLNNVSASATTIKIENVASAATISAWTFFSDVSDVYGNPVGHYDQGSWTPQIDRSTTSPTLAINVQEAVWTKIGRQVILSGRINITGVTAQGTGLWKLTNLPFAAAALPSSLRYSAIFSQRPKFTGIGVTCVGAYLSPAGTEAFFCDDAGNAISGNMDNASASINFSLQYIADS